MKKIKFVANNDERILNIDVELIECQPVLFFFSNEKENWYS